MRVERRKSLVCKGPHGPVRRESRRKEPERSFALGEEDKMALRNS
jgi:hypothetical protein